MKDAQSQALPPILEKRTAAALHEALLEASTALAEGMVGGDLIAEILQQHEPHNPPVTSLFTAQHGQPVCRGCDRAQNTPTRNPGWPCSTYKIIARRLLQVEAVQLRVPQRETVLLIVLDEDRAAAHGPGKHRGDGSIDTRPALRPSMELSNEPSISQRATD